MIEVWQPTDKELYLAMRDGCKIEENPSIVAVGSDGLFLAYLFYLNEDGTLRPNKYACEKELREEGYNTSQLLWDADGGFAGIKPANYKAPVKAKSALEEAQIKATQTHQQQTSSPSVVDVVMNDEDDSSD